MPLGKKLGNQNNIVQSQLAGTQQPVADAGFNTQNVRGLQPAPALTNDDVNNIRQTTYEAQQEYRGHEANNYGLVKPQVPQGPQYPDQQMSVLVVEKMWRIICQKKLHGFYTQAELQDLVNRACRHDYKILKQQWNLPTFDMAVDLSILGLFNIVILGDDSGSMQLTEPLEDNLTRWDILKIVVKTIGFFATLMDSDGIDIRFLNSNLEGNGVGTLQEVEDLFRRVSPSGGTPIGEVLDRKILQGLVLPFLNGSGGQKLNKPVITITITDGEPSNRDAVVNTILKCKQLCANSRYGPNAMLFSFAQVGRDAEAAKFLNFIDTHNLVGDVIDCTSEFSMEQKECGPGFTESVWVIKLLLGSADSSYDQADEGGPTPTGMVPQGTPSQSSANPFDQFGQPNTYGGQNTNAGYNNNNGYQQSTQYQPQYQQQPQQYQAQPPKPPTNSWNPFA